MIKGRKIALAPIELEMQKNKRRGNQFFLAERSYCIVLMETEEIVGQVNYCGYTSDERKVEIGIEIDYPDRGHGYGEDALFHFLDYLFSRMQVKRVQLAVFTDNQPAINLYRKLGFEEKHVIVSGGYSPASESFRDILRMELTPAHWLNYRQAYLFKI